MAVAIHRWGEQHQQAVAALGDAVYAASPAVYQEWQVAADAHRKDSLRLVACEEGGGPTVGYGCLWPVHQPYMRVHVAVHPRWQRRGVGSLLWEALRGAIVSDQAATAEGRVWEARAEAVRFLRRRGFVPAQHLPGLRLVLADTDPSALRRRRDRAAAQGFRFTTLCQEQAGAPAWSTKLQELLNEVWPDMPQMTPGAYDPTATRAAPPAPVFRTVEELACLTTWPEAFFLAKRGEQYVGWSSLARRGGDPGTVGVGDTGVRRAFRGRGLATALKAEAIAFAKRRGYRVILTKTANPAMLAVNEAVGFRREQGEIRLVWDRRAPAVSRDDD